MLHFSLSKTIAILLSCLLGILAIIPNFLSKDTLASLPGWATNRIGLGLDLRGGAYLLLSMNTEELRQYWLKSIADEARQKLLDKKLGFAARPAVVAGAVQVRPAKPEDMAAVEKELNSLIQPVGGGGFTGSGNPDRTITRDDAGGFLTIALTQPAVTEKTTAAISSAIEVVRRRVDALGNKEANVVRQGADRILVQVPGLENTEELKQLIGQTAKLTFQMVHPSISPEEAKATRVPSGYKLLPADPRGETPEASYVIEDIVIVSGEDLVDSQPGFDSRTGEPIIGFRFNTKGAQKFGKATKDNVGRPFAIVIDNGEDQKVKGKRDIYVISAPVIREPILGGSGQISGNFTIQSANQLAIQLRSGALPATLTTVEERVVGASLGQDSIDAGKRASIIGIIGVAVFMIFAYGLFGVFAVIAAALNIVFVIAVMSVMQSTMTLPGIAGIVLTIGMAVDANVLINERIREELRNGKTPIAAIDAGFERAFGTIIDAQLTTFFAGVLMFMLGAGPVRGFAITLTLGVISTVYTAFTLTRLMVWWWVVAHKTRKIPAPMDYKAART